MHAEQASVPAATAVLLRDGDDGLETLLLRRASKLAFHAGAWVFPGGRVDPDDDGVDDLERARRAAVREAHEEAGLVIDAAQLVPLSHWTTPPGQVRRFSTWFFTAVVDAAAEVTVDGGEISTHRWMSAAEALEAQAGGELELPPPTFVTLTELRVFGSARAAVETMTAQGPPFFEPKLVSVDGGVVSLYEGDGGYASADPTVAGASHRLEMLEAGWRYIRTP